jgi:hypothetical protein
MEILAVMFATFTVVLFYRHGKMCGPTLRVTNVHFEVIHAFSQRRGKQWSSTRVDRSFAPDT